MFVVNKLPQSMSAEAYRLIRTSIEYSGVDKKIKTIVITSSISGEGKSTVCGNLAYVLSKNNSRVLVIDCDLRKPIMHRKFNVDGTKGITDILVEKSSIKDTIVKVDNNLFLLPCGTIPPNPSEILGSRSMEEFIKELSINYDYIIFDTPPVLAVTDAQLLAAKADATILVVRANKTKGKIILNAYKELEKVNAKVIGTILNDLTSENQRLYSGYGYGYGNKKFNLFKRIKG